MIKGYRKPIGAYIELDDKIPHSDAWIEVALRPDETYTFSDTWNADPMNVSICWRPKTQAELDLETTTESENHWKDNPENDSLMMLLYTLYQKATGTTPTKAAFWNKVKAIRTGEKFFDGTF